MFIIRVGEGTVITCLTTQLYRWGNPLSIVHRLSDPAFRMRSTNHEALVSLESLRDIHDAKLGENLSKP
jgi:hypothetical protein